MDLVGFALLAAVLVAIPGPAVTLMMKQPLMRGGSEAIKTAAGVFRRVGLAGLESRVGDATLRASGAVLVFFGVRLALEPPTDVHSEPVERSRGRRPVSRPSRSRSRHHSHGSKR